MRGSTPTYDVVADRCWDDPGLDAFADTMRATQTPARRRLDTALGALRAASADPERLVLLAEIAAEPLGAELDVVRAALTEGAPDADLLALACVVTVMQAWHVRSSGRAESVPEHAWGLFHRLCDEADEYGRRALLLRPGHPVAAVYRLTSGRGLGLVGSEWWQRFDVARLECPTLVPAHQMLLQALCDKWYGDHDTMLDFARRTSAEAPAGHPVAAVLALAHAELWLAAESAEQRQHLAAERLRDESAVRWHSSALLAADATHGRHPRAVEAHHAFAWWLSFPPQAAASTEIRKAHLVRTRGRLAALPWSYYGDRMTAFTQALSGAGVQPQQLDAAR